jgi:hypothetical protein
MRLRTPKNQEIYEENIWPLLAGHTTPTQVAKRHSINRSVPGMWLNKIRGKLGGKEPAKRIAELVLKGEIVPNSKTINDLKPKLIAEYLNKAIEGLDGSRLYSFQLEKSFHVIFEKLLLNAQQQAERGSHRYSKQDCSGRPVQLERDLTPDELFTLTRVLKSCEQFDDLVETRKNRRSKQEKELAKREIRAAYLLTENIRKEGLLTLLFTDYQRRVEELKKREAAAT